MELKNEFYKIGTNDKAMLEFFKENNFTSFYNDFKSACKTRKSGSGLLGSGIALSCLGSIMTTVGVTVADDYSSTFLLVSGIIVLGTGEILTIVSIPVSVSAGARKKVIKNNFAREYFGIDRYSYQPKLNFGLNTSGIGFTLNF